MKPITRLLIALAWPLLALVLPAFATTDSVIAVCVSGPPTCDTASIQAAIDAANFGDTVVVSAGTYTEQLTLKSGITLTSTDGPTNTIVTALASPIISGSNLLSTTIFGVSIEGNSIVTISEGVNLFNSSLILSNAQIGQLQGFNGSGVSINGQAASGLQINGVYSVTLFNVSVDDITGGNVEISSSGHGGDAIGVFARGSGQLQIISSSVRDIHGGNPAPLTYARSGIGAGGNSTGVSLIGDTALIIDHSVISGLTGGLPSHLVGSPPCPVNAGDAVAVQVISGTLDLSNSQISDIQTWATDLFFSNSTQAIGILSAHNSHVNIHNTQIVSLTVRTLPILTNAPTSPFCGPRHGSTTGLLSEAANDLTADHNSIKHLVSPSAGDESSGFDIHASHAVTISHNLLHDISGGVASGIGISATDAALVTHNRVTQLRGGDGQGIAYGFATNGNPVIAVRIADSTYAQIANNLLDTLTGGNGLDNTWPFCCADDSNGGDAVGIQIDHSTSLIQNNTLYGIQGGVRGFPVGLPGQGIAIDLGGGTSALVLNNAIISSTVGVSATANNYLWDYNTLWQTDLNYSGIVTGPHDLHADPRFIDATHGDFRLSFNSPLIDVGFNVIAPTDDFAGNPRPIDGNGDGVPITDIGAYEYQPTPLHRCYLPVIAHITGQ